MSTKETIALNEQLTNSRQEIALWLKEHPLTESITNTNSTASRIPNLFAELLIIAIADRMLNRSFELQTGKSILPSITLAKDLFQTLTREKPRLMLGLAVITGAAITASRPWRWFTQKNAWTGLLSQLLWAVVTHVLEKKNSR